MVDIGFNTIEALQTDTILVQLLFFINMQELENSSALGQKQSSVVPHKTLYKLFYLLYYQLQAMVAARAK